jgi:hypothetical protein
MAPGCGEVSKVGPALHELQRRPEGVQFKVGLTESVKRQKSRKWLNPQKLGFRPTKL